jgi:uncharacterized membrane protein YidH (DUF202 family)
MKPLTLVGAVLVILGIGGLVYGSLNYTTKEKVLDIGPIQATADEEHHVPIPQIASIAAVIAGVAFVVISSKRA